MAAFSAIQFIPSLQFIPPMQMLVVPIVESHKQVEQLQYNAVQVKEGKETNAVYMHGNRDRLVALWLKPTLGVTHSLVLHHFTKYLE